MLTKRIVPCLDIDAGRVVKGTKFLNLRDVGDPVDLAERYEREGADELVLLDITAASEARASGIGGVAPRGGTRLHPGHARRWHAHGRGHAGGAERGRG